MAEPPAVTGFLFDMQLWDIALSLPLTVIGLAATFIQATRARRTAEAARQAAVGAQDRMARSHMLILLPQLHRIEDDLDTAIKEGEVKLILNYLSGWRWQAGQARQILEQEVNPNNKAIRAITKSVALATRTKLDIVASEAAGTSTQPALVTATRPLSEAIAAATSELGALSQTYSRDAGGTSASS